MKRTVLIATLSAIACAEQVVLPDATEEPDWFKTRPQSFQGPTATGAAPFLAQTNPAPFGHTTYSANYPLETGEPIKGSHGRNAFHEMGNLSPYHPGEHDWGVEEHPRPDGSEITQMHMLHRHGSRYPAGGHLDQWGQKIMDATGQFTGRLAFLNDWRYGLGAEILVTRGRQELFDSGVLNFFNYGALYNASSGKIVVRTTTQDRMLKSAENFLSGFFNLEWAEHVNLLAMIEHAGFNTSLMSSYACPNSGQLYGAYSAKPATTWREKYLASVTDKLKSHSGDYDWSITDSYNAQQLCAYETVSVGYSTFCSLFTYKEWQGFTYQSDLWFSAASGFLSPAGRAQGITWVQEFLARVQAQPFNDSSPSAANLTLNSNPVTFPLDQSLYLDFAHDTILISVLTAFGFEKLAGYMDPEKLDRNRGFRTNRVVPFAARINIEVITAPHEIKAKRPRHGHRSPYVEGTGETRYVHFLLNQRTLPIHDGFEACGQRDDGWCELDTFIEIQRANVDKARFEYSCVGDWELGEYGDYLDGLPSQD